jgi:hypothetical protein
VRVLGRSFCFIYVWIVGVCGKCPRVVLICLRVLEGGGMTEGGEDFGGVEFRFKVLVATALRYVSWSTGLSIIN